MVLISLFKTNSRGHLKVRHILEESGFVWEEEYSFSDLIASSGRPLAFDFMVMDDDGNIDFAIEVNGEQHYEPVAAFGGPVKFHRQVYNDNQKREYCKRHGIPLVEIPYWELEIVNIAYLLEKAGI